MAALGERNNPYKHGPNGKCSGCNDLVMREFDLYETRKALANLIKFAPCPKCQCNKWFPELLGVRNTTCVVCGWQPGLNKHEWKD